MTTNAQLAANVDGSIDMKVNGVTRLSIAADGTLTGANAGKLLGLLNILGTVSQSGGVPTGGVIERGSNANGEYVRFADGTQICWHSVDITPQALSTEADVLKTWPAAFVNSSYRVLINPYQTSSGSKSDLGAAIMNGIFLSTPTNNSIVASMYTYRYATVDYIYCYLLAIGRWF